MVQQCRSLDASKAQKELMSVRGQYRQIGACGKEKRKERRIDIERLILSIKASG